MAVTYYVALPFIRTEEGVAPGEAQECQSEGTAMLPKSRARPWGRSIIQKSNRSRSRMPPGAVVKTPVWSKNGNGRKNLFMGVGSY
jgi:hypothetical protein